MTSRIDSMPCCRSSLCKSSMLSSQVQPAIVLTRIKSFRDCLVAAGHGVLRGLGDQHEPQHIRDAELPDIATQDEPKQQEQEPVQHRAAHDELEDGHMDGEERGQRRATKFKHLGRRWHGGCND